MTRILSKLVLVVVLICALGGCALFHKPDAALVAGMDAGLNGGPNGADILSKYDVYVESDPKLTADTKKIEHATVAKLRKLIADAKQ